MFIVEGLLIEPNVKSYKKLLKKNRHVETINSCVSRTQMPELVDFINADGISGIEGKFTKKVYSNYTPWIKIRNIYLVAYNFL